MTEKEHLECEIKELELEIKSGKTTISTVQRILDQKVQKLKEMNHRTPYKPQVEYYDEQLVIINGVQYQRVEPPKLQTLYDALYEKGNMYSSVCNTVIEIVKEWLPDEVIEDGEDYNRGWNDYRNRLKKNLK